MLSGKQAARIIDISAVQACSSRSDLDKLVCYGKKYRFINLHVLPSWVSTLSGLLKGEPDILVGSPVGFPSGGHTTATKIFEAQQLLKDGVQEMDIVMNIGRFKNREYDYVLKELRSIIDVVENRIPTKVIIEINILSDDEIFKACDIVMESGAAFVKTGTGWISGGVNLEQIQKIKEHCNNYIKLKVAGGIRSRDEFLTMVDMGVERMGINVNSAVEIVESLSYGDACLASKVD